MKRRREDSQEDEGPSPIRLRQDLVEARHAREKAELEKRVERAELEKQLAVERAERRVERAELEKQLAVEKAELEKQLAVENAERRAERAELEKQLAGEKAELEKRAERAELEKQLAVEKAERRGAELEKELEDRASWSATQEEAKKKEMSPQPRPSIVAKKLPWLLDKSPMRRALPNTLWGHILTFSSDHDLFNQRSLSLTHYAAYFGQRVVPRPWSYVYRYPRPTTHFNSLRAVSLARMGRRFPRVEVLHDTDNTKLSIRHLKAIHRVAFPALRGLDVAMSSAHKEKLNETNFLSHITTLPKLKHLAFSCLTDQGWGVTEDKFPALQKLKIHILENEEEENIRVAAQPHSKIEDLVIWVVYLPERVLSSVQEVVDWSTVTKTAFPELKRLQGHHVPDLHKARLASLGVDVTGPRLVLS